MVSLQHAIERAEQLGLFDLNELEALLRRNRGSAGSGKLRAALDVYVEPAFTRSEIERRFLALVRAAGLPIPSVNVFVVGCEIDFFWPRERFGVELDGFTYHRTQAAFERDRLRDEDMKLAGISTQRVTVRRLERDPQGVIRRLRLLLEQRRREVGQPG
jgi:hypothetical protein